MGRFLRFAACLSLFIMPVMAGPWQFDAGLRGSIYDDNYKLGLGGELGLVKGLGADWDLGLHANYSHFRIKTENWTPADEFGGYLTVYYLPKIEQDFSLKIGPHLGYAYIRSHYVDVGGDVKAVVQIVPTTSVYAAFIPGFFVGKNPQALIRVGLGINYSLGM